ncbi:hypothetical protein NDU88_003855 [Pleurodeles waltl]|uniref:Uncharacterized protein n=1 Tax=Pleurodeles waltl TaxID=8319 RepID=A0AAV7UFI3_PLEWA|nr:hypothetical protein NDU88_003855 [Pleurodeles waltl]
MAVERRARASGRSRREPAGCEDSQPQYPPAHPKTPAMRPGAHAKGASRGKERSPPTPRPDPCRRKGCSLLSFKQAWAPGAQQGIPERPHWKACAQRPLLHRSAQAYC